MVRTGTRSQSGQKRNAPESSSAARKGKGPATPQERPIADRFISASAAKRYADGQFMKAAIPERGVQFDPDTEQDMVAQVNNRGWHKLCTHPARGIQQVVREFYINLPDCEPNEGYVRGKTINFSRDIINQHYGLRRIENDELHQLGHAKEDLLMISTLTCHPGAQWEMSSSGNIIGMQRDALTAKAKVWMHFVTASLLPTESKSLINVSRMQVIYAIMAGLTIDVGYLINQNIRAATTAKEQCPRFASLITHLCREAGVEFTPTDTLVPNKRVLTMATMRAEPVRRAAKPLKARKEAKGKTMKNQIEDIAKKVANIQVDLSRDRRMAAQRFDHSTAMMSAMMHNFMAVRDHMSIPPEAMHDGPPPFIYESEADEPAAEETDDEETTDDDEDAQMDDVAGDSDN